MRYFFHIFDGPKIFPDGDGRGLSSLELAILQAKALAFELNKAGELCRSNLVFVLDENMRVTRLLCEAESSSYINSTIYRRVNRP
jgi:Domain of unknown function (DUF6894)